MTSLVFKFRDDLLLRANASWVTILNLNADYFSEATRFFSTNQQAGIYPFTDPESRLIERLKALDEVLRELKNTTGLQPRFLFGNTVYKYINPLWQRLIDYRQNNPSGPGVQPLAIPNFFNYFRIDFPKDYHEEPLQALLMRIGKFLPHLSAADEHLLTYAYLKDDPISPGDEHPSSSQAHDAGGNQFYLSDMDFPDGIFPATTQSSVRMNMTIIEVNSWDLTHTQFSSARHEVIFPENEDLVLTINPVTGKLDHGTQILGILLANSTDRDERNLDFCQGIMPDLSVRLVSCITGLTEDSTQYEEECAVLAAVSATQSGETILIEVSTSNLPLDVMPAVYELLSIAHQLDITVVAAAGNGGMIVNAAPTVQTALATSDFRTAITGTPGNPLPHWNAYGAVYDRIADLYSRYDLPGQPQQFSSINDFVSHYYETPSKAILIGAILRENDNYFKVLLASNRGDRIKVFAQGNTILTTHPASQFFSAMGNTSSAAAIVAGLVVLAQRIARDRGRVIPPASMFAWLKRLTKGHPVKELPAGLKGVVPLWINLKAKLDWWLD